MVNFVRSVSNQSVAQRISEDPQSRLALEIIQRLRKEGHVSYLAGGCVRDALLGRTPKDYDVATDARPEQIRKLFGFHRTLAIGAAFGVISVCSESPQKESPVEVATFRCDGIYSDGRRPDAVEFSSPAADAQRRDFTINGLFFDPASAQVIDFVGGVDDLAESCIRAIGDAASRFSEDKLRLLRAVRFATTYGFTIEEETKRAVCQHAR
jgi:poly(A) polymerase